MKKLLIALVLGFSLVAHAADKLDVNDIGEVVFELQQPLPLSTFAANRVGGALIVVDPASHRTSGALLVTQTVWPTDAQTEPQP